jgi:tRNA (guanine37-N1)-methyltransferase
MVLMAPPVVNAVEAVQGQTEPSGRLIALTPSGRTLNQDWVRDLAAERRLVLLCGRYEGFDERIFEVLEPELLSIGDYVLSGGEVAAMVVIDAVMRLIPGVLGDDQSAVDESFGLDGGLEYPHYTRPREYRGRAVPEILLGGDHAAIDRWRRAQGRARTIDRRGDLVRPEPEPTPKPNRKRKPSPIRPNIEPDEHNLEHEPPGEPDAADRDERMG